MSFAGAYLSGNAGQAALVAEPPADDLKIIVTIPAYNESGFEKSLDSLFKTTLFHGSAEVLILVNWPENISEEYKSLNREIYNSMQNWALGKNSQSIRFHILQVPDLPQKKAGAGLARKLVMDEAVRRFDSLDRADGIICSFDADTLCEPGYFQAISEHFRHYSGSEACSVYFEHPIDGEEFPEEVYRGICLYELHMRYFLQAERFTTHPNCFHTVGSSFAVLAGAYCRQGGMNQRKAGEDFYFLQKFIDIGSFSECQTTRLIPSPRPSLRVPFGTGAAIYSFLHSGKDLVSYNLLSFLEIKDFIEKVREKVLRSDVPDVHTMNLPEVISGYLTDQNFSGIIKEIIDNTSGNEAFMKRFFRWFNMFRMLKFLNYSRQYHPDVPVIEAAGSLLKIKGINYEPDCRSLLEIFRKADRSGL